MKHTKNEQPNKQKAIFMNKEPRQFTDFSSGQDGWGNDDQEWEEWAEKLGNWGELDLGEDKPEDGEVDKDIPKTNANQPNTDDLR